MKRKPIKYRHSYLWNPVTIGFLLLIGLMGATLWSTGPSLLIRVESGRILKTTAEKFLRNRARLLESDKALDQLHQAMIRELYAAKVTDPEMEAWIEVDEAGYAEIGVIYDLQTEWPFGIAKPTTYTVRQLAKAQPK